MQIERNPDLDNANQEENILECDSAPLLVSSSWKTNQISVHDLKTKQELSTFEGAQLKDMSRIFDLSTNRKIIHNEQTLVARLCMKFQARVFSFLSITPSKDLPIWRYLTSQKKDQQRKSALSRMKARSS